MSWFAALVRKLRGQRREPMPAQFEELADYNARRNRGQVFDAEAVVRMGKLQEEFWRYSRERFISEHAGCEIIESPLGMIALRRKEDHE